MLLATATAAQTPLSANAFTDPANGVSLDEAIARALAQEPSLRAARTAIDVARGLQVQAGVKPNPSVSVELRGEPAGTDNQTMVSMEWPLDLFRRQGRVAVADQEVAATEHSVADRERLLASDVRGRFGDALVAVRDLAILEELIDATRRQRDLLRARVDAGTSPPLEHDLVDVELRRLDGDRVLQLGRVERAMFELKRLLGVSPTDALLLRDTLEDAVNREGAALTTVGTVDGRADVREAQARIAVANAKIDRAQRDSRFDVSLFAGYTRMDAGFPQLGFSPTGGAERVRGQFHYVSGGAMVSVPIRNRNQGEIAAARAERAGAVALEAAAVLSAQTELAAARALDQRARQAVQLYGRDARALARQNLAVIRQSYELGRVPIFEVLAEQKRYLDLERAYTESLRVAYEARTFLNRALGEKR
jgi:cobalt-zinc-cadmium efflux system outer membrane protein